MVDLEILEKRYIKLSIIGIYNKYLIVNRNPNMLITREVVVLNLNQLLLPWTQETLWKFHDLFYCVVDLFHWDNTSIRLRYNCHYNTYCREQSSVHCFFIKDIEFDLPNNMINKLSSSTNITWQSSTGVSIIFSSSLFAWVRKRVCSFTILVQCFPESNYEKDLLKVVASLTSKAISHCNDYCWAQCDVMTFGDHSQVNNSHTDNEWLDWRLSYPTRTWITRQKNS